MDRRRPIPTNRGQTAAASRARVLAAATVVFNTLGYDRATMRDLARKAGVSTGCIFSHFSGKQALWEACCGGMRMPTPAAYMEVVHMLDIMSGEAIRLDSPADVFRAERALETARMGI